MKIFHIFSLIAFVFLIGCNSKSNNLLPNNSNSTVEKSKDSIEGTAWLRKVYDSINEPHLNNLGYESYRFNYLDSFGSNKLFRLKHIGENKTILIVKFYDTEGDYKSESFKIKLEQTIKLTSDQYDEFKALIDGSYFWSLNMIENPKRMFLDGYSYLLEGFEPKRPSSLRYQVVVREVPHDGTFKEACDKLIEFYNESK